jgi:hypothetical protein
MVIARTSPLTGRENSLDLPVTLEQLAAHRAGALAQDAFPDLTPEQREFLISGYTPEDWNALFG